MTENENKNEQEAPLTASGDTPSSTVSGTPVAQAPSAPSVPPTSEPTFAPAASGSAPASATPMPAPVAPLQGEAAPYNAHQAATQQTPPMQPSYQAAPVYAQPQPPYVPAPLMQLTGGMKFGWFVVGALVGIPGIIISWLVNVDKMPQVKSDAIKWSLIGLGAWIVLSILIGFLIGGMIASTMAVLMGSFDMGSYGSGYYGSW